MDPTTTAPTRGATFTAWKWLQMPLVAGSLLLVAYLGLSFVNDSAGTLSTDVGGKVATLGVMDAWDTSAPEVGYWASDWDPEAELHGLSTRPSSTGSSSTSPRCR